DSTSDSIFSVPSTYITLKLNCDNFSSHLACHPDRSFCFKRLTSPLWSVLQDLLNR
ncbi:hypothetical protein P691DRAFT_685011, partial [Macrolepiota fuliginosa MF-IS2]